jgi:hypothetical protein
MIYEISPHTIADEIADEQTVAASDEAFAQFGPTRDTLPPSAVSSPLSRLGIRAMHTAERVGSGRLAQSPKSIERRDIERDEVGLPPAYR